MAYDKGVRSFIVSEDLDETEFPNANILQCADGFSALQRMARFHRERFSFPVIAITGSNGKTIVKEWLYQIFSSKYRCFRTPKSFNSQVGVPLSLWKLHDKYDIAFIEAGISQKGEMGALRKIIQPAEGLITNIGTAHGSGFDSQKQKLKEKLKLFKKVEKIYLCKDHTTIIKSLSRSKADIISWSRYGKADLEVHDIVKSVTGSQIDAKFHNTALQFEIPFSDEASIENALLCALIALEHGFTPQEIASIMPELEPVAMRLELKEGLNQCKIISDIYNADMESLQVALHYQVQQSSGLKRTLILSDLLESNLEDKQLYKRIAELILENGVQRVITVGSRSALLGKNLPSRIAYQHFSNTGAFLAELKEESFRNESILLKAARVFTFERISRFLELKSHFTQLSIDMNALGHNLRYFSQLLDPGVRLMVMQKAFGYGSGSFELAHFLEYQKLDYIAVAYLDEGIDLRKAGITCNILVLHPHEDQFDELANHSLEAEIYSLKILDALITYVKESGNNIPIHLKLDTGMHRLGFVRSEMKRLISRLKANKDLTIASVFSHLAAADNPGGRSFFCQADQTI